MGIGNSRRVAVAADQAVFRRGLSAMASSLKGFDLVGEAQDGLEIAQLCELVEPDLVFLAFQSPFADNYRLTLELHRRRPQLKIFLFVRPEDQIPSAFDSAASDAAASDAAGYTLCFLPFDISEEEFASTVLKACSQRIETGSPIPNPEALRADDIAWTNQLQQEAFEIVKVETINIGPDPGELIAQELHMAGKIQASILPEKPPSIPGWDLSAKLVSARETSGDFYDFIPLANQNWGIVIADVTDKGIGAALFMALSNTLIRTFAARYPTMPALTMDVVNDRILSDTRGSMFVTAFYGVLEPHTARFKFVNAGHPPPLLARHQKGKPVDYLTRTGVALGLLEDSHWQQKIIRLRQGDVLVLYTDGIIEAQNDRGEFFGDRRLLEVVRSVSSHSAYDIQEAVLEELHRFTGDTPGQDDIALVVLCRKE